MTSYIPLYRKYRPATFKDLVGQEILVKTLSNAINTKRIAHAYLLAGPRGTGKTSTARILAMSLNCIEGPTVTPCGKCNNCIDLINGSAIDVIEIDAASNNSVEDARNILEKVQFVPVSGKYKIYIIDEVHMLSNAAFNTLLKTLEEPPDNLVFVLATTEPHKVLDTIISRCQRFDFRRITVEDIIKRLEFVIKQENINIEDKAISLIARKSLGGLRDALALLDQVSVIQSENYSITQSDVLKIIGSISHESLFEIAKLVSKKDTVSIIKMINSLSDKGNEPQIIIKELVGYYRNLMIFNSVDTLNDEIKNIVLLSEDFIDDTFKLSKEFELNEIVQIIEKLTEFELNIKITTNPYLWLEVALISITNRENITLLSDLEKRVEALEVASFVQMSQPKQSPAIQKVEISNSVKTTVDNVIEKKPKEKPQPLKEKKEELVYEDNFDDYEDEQIQQENVSENTNVQVSSEPDNISDIKQLWADLLKNIESVPSRMFFLNLAKPLKITQEYVVITFKNETFVKQAQDSNKMDPLKNAATKLLGKEPAVSIITSDSVNNTEQKKAGLKKEQSKPQANSSLALETKKYADEEPVKAEETNNIASDTKVYSDEEANVMNLFNGKILT